MCSRSRSFHAMTFRFEIPLRCELAGRVAAATVAAATVAVDVDTASCEEEGAIRRLRRIISMRRL